MHTPEWYEKRDLDAFLAKLGPELCFIVKPTTGGYGESGHPDRCACITGTFWGFELKRPGKKPTPIQQKRIDAIWKAGGRPSAAPRASASCSCEVGWNREASLLVYDILG